MPYVEGESLREQLDRQHQLPVDEALAIGRALAEALQTAHEAGIVHGDVKPANILLGRGGPLVADFGIALALARVSEARLTEPISAWAPRATCRGAGHRRRGRRAAERHLRAGGSRRGC